MPSFGLIGPTYKADNVAISPERTVNLYPMEVEVPTGASRGTRYALVHTPGTEDFVTLPKSPIRCLWAGNDRLYAVAGDTVFQVKEDGSYTSMGVIGGPSNSPAQMCGNSRDILVWNGEIPTEQNPVTGFNTYLLHGGQCIPVISSGGITYIDGYYVALRPGGPDFAGDPVPVTVQHQAQFNLSGLLDGLTWDPLQYAVKTGSFDECLMIIGPGSFNGAMEELWLMNRKTIEVWYNTGGTALNPFPFERAKGAFINIGLWAKFGVVGFKNTIVFPSASERGIGPVVKMNGYIPERISNHAVEREMQACAVQGSSFSDAIAYGYEEDGHEFYVITFLAASRQFVCDLTTNQWHERAAGTNPNALTAPPSVFHATVLGKRYCADMNSGKIRRTSRSIYQHSGSPILRMRVTPNLNNERKMMFYDKLWLDVGGPFSTTRTYTLESSNDGGQSWNSGRTVSIGPGQQSVSRVEWRRLGKSRNRAFRITTTDNHPQAWVDGYITFRNGTGG